MARTASCTLYGILARDGWSAVVFRRGPTRAVLLLRWWLDSDTIEEGQWFRGRIYEDRCDLSPNGEYLVYFAAKHWRVDQLHHAAIESTRLMRAGWEIARSNAHRRRHQPDHSNVILSSVIVRTGPPISAAPR